MRFEDYRRNLKFFNCKFDGNAVAVCSQAANDTRREIGQVGMVPKAFPAIDVRNMYLDKRYGNTCQRITQSNAGMGQGARINDDRLNPFFFRYVYAINQFT